MVWWVPLAAAAASAVGSMINNERNIEAAQENRDFQERMSSTAHQREVQDLRAAGLNPILSAKYGGASTPGGSFATTTDPIGPAVNTFMQAKQMQADLELKEQSASAQEAAARKTNAEAIAAERENSAKASQYLPEGPPNREGEYGLGLSPAERTAHAEMRGRLSAGERQTSEAELASIRAKVETVFAMSNASWQQWATAAQAARTWEEQRKLLIENGISEEGVRLIERAIGAGSGAASILRSIGQLLRK